LDRYRSKLVFGKDPKMRFMGTVEKHKAIRILSIEDHPVFREGLRAIIGSQSDMLLVGQAVDAAEGIKLFSEQLPDITLVDLRLPDQDGVTVLTELRRLQPTCHVIILTTSDSQGDIQRALRAGAAGYILKSMSNNEIVSVIRSVQIRGRYIPAQVASRLAEHMGEEELSARELDVLGLIRDGYRNKQIADQLGIAETTVNYHIKNLVEKLQANDRTHAVTIALRRGLLPL
jgi:DNA-binding NarL/FixJ family response regulator